MRRVRGKLRRVKLENSVWEQERMSVDWTHPPASGSCNADTASGRLDIGGFAGGGFGFRGFGLLVFWAALGGLGAGAGLVGGLFEEHCG